MIGYPRTPTPARSPYVAMTRSEAVQLAESVAHAINAVEGVVHLAAHMGNAAPVLPLIGRARTLRAFYFAHCEAHDIEPRNL